PADSKLRVAVQSELIANEPVPPGTKDPRAAAVLESPLESEWYGDHDTRVFQAESFPDIGRLGVAADLAPGERLRLVKFLAYGWSSQRSLPAIRDQVIAAVGMAKYAGWDGLAKGQRA